jgi:hypothetical protein
MIAATLEQPEGINVLQTSTGQRRNSKVCLLVTEGISLEQQKSDVEDIPYRL